MKSKIKVLRLFSRLNVGGPALHVINLTAGLRAYGYDTDLGVGSLEPGEGSFELYAKEKGVLPHRLSGFRAAIRPWDDLRAFVEIIRLIREARPQIVHTHTFKAGLLGRIAAKLCGVPIIVHTYHGHLLQGYWRPWKTALVRWAEKILCLFTNRVIAVSPQVAADLIQQKVTSETKTSVISLGFDLDYLDRLARENPPLLRQRLGIPASAKLVGIIGRLVPVKAFERFLGAFCPLLLEDPALHLVIIGEGPLEANLRALADQLCAPETRSRLHFTGWVLPLYPHYRDLDLCVCSSHNEGTSVAIIEAVLAGLPVISTRVGGMADLLENGRWGVLVEPSTPALQQAGRCWLRGEQKPVPEAKEVFRKKFGLERLLAEIDTIYREKVTQTTGLS